MSKLIIEPGKLVTEFKDIEHIVDAVSARMDEPGLRNKIIQLFVLSEEKMVKYQKMLAKKIPYSLPEEQYRLTRALYFNPRPHLFVIFVKENKIEEIVPHYFHEVGHVANTESLSYKHVPQDTLVVVNEATANAFMFWAVEELNEISTLQYADTFSLLLDELRSQHLPENFDKKVPVTRAASEALTWQYAVHEFTSAKEAYHWFKDTLHNEEKLSRFCEQIKKQFLKASL